jgi:hypothetical protein
MHACMHVNAQGMPRLATIVHHIAGTSASKALSQHAELSSLILFGSTLDHFSTITTHSSICLYYIYSYNYGIRQGREQDHRFTSSYLPIEEIGNTGKEERRDETSIRISA